MSRISERGILREPIWSVKLVDQAVEMRRAQSAKCEASRIFTTWGNNVENHLTSHSEIHSEIAE